MRREKILVSACLLWEKVRYDGKDNYVEGLERLKADYDLIPLCPEVLGGLSVPRDPAEIIRGRILTNKGKDVTAQFLLGAQDVLDFCLKNNIHKAIMKDRSPSCGKGRIYDGSFSNRLVEGNGVTVELLQRNHIKVYSEEEIGGI